jgi:hypothetical protein
MAMTAIQQALEAEEALLSAGTCRHCGGLISAAMRISTKYCKASCRVAAYNRRQREKATNLAHYAATHPPQPLERATTAASVASLPTPTATSQPELLDEIDRWMRIPIGF